MSPLLIGSLVAGGLVILLAIGFISHTLERSRLERARQIAELRSRLRYCDSVAAQLPGQFMSPELKSVLLTMQQNLLDKLQKLDRKESRYAGQLEDIQQQLASGELKIDNPPVSLANEEQAREARLQLENLHKLLTQASKEGQIDKAALQQWSARIQQYLVTTALELFQSLARQGMQQGKPRVAKLQYERAIAYLQKQNDPAYAEHLVRLRVQLRDAEHAVMRSEQTTTTDSSELVAGLDALEQDDDAWKKKAVYDD